MNKLILKSIKGRNALITGGSDGIGLEFCKQLRSLGVNLHIVGRDVRKLSEVEKGLASRYDINVRTLSCDLSKDGSAAHVHTSFPKIDILVNNAGSGFPKLLDKCNIIDEAHIIHLNCTTPMQLTALYLSGMKERGFGCIIFVASSMGFGGVPYMGNYSATKAYLITLAQAVYAENNQSGIIVQALCPGPIDTPGAKLHQVDFKRIPISQSSAHEIVKCSLKGLNGKLILVPGYKNKLFVSLIKCNVIYPIISRLIKVIAKRALRI